MNNQVVETGSAKVSETNSEELTPQQIVAELDRYIIGQDDAKKAVAIALRNRWRRLQLDGEIREEITPKNIIMIGPTGVGKTEISRRLAKLAKAPFVKVEASKFTEVGYVGRDVESIIRDLVEVARTLVKKEERQRVSQPALQIAENKLLDILLPTPEGNGTKGAGAETTREKLREMLAAGKMDDRIVEIETTKQQTAHLEVLGPPGMGEVEGQLKDMFSNMMPKSTERREVPVKEATKLLYDEAVEELIDMDRVSREALKRAELSGIVFIDEIDKICVGSDGTRGPDVSREGVQRDLLPLVEGCTVSTKYGTVKTDHILFIASGAFHTSKPSDLMAEFQGRFPIRVELTSLEASHFVRILTEPRNSLTRQYSALLGTEGVELEFTDDGISQLAELTAAVNDRTEDIGARRLHTLLEKLLEEVSYEASDSIERSVKVDESFVKDRLSNIAQDADLSRFIL